MAAAVALLQRRHPDLQVLLPAGLPGFEPTLQRALQEAGATGVHVFPAGAADGLRPQLCAAADAALTKSGTANLELALREVPQVTGYRVSRPTAFLAKHVLHFNVAHISPVNLVLGERLVPELLQDDLTPDAIVAGLLPLFDPASGARERVLEGYGRLRRKLGEPGVTRRAATAILEPFSEQAPCD